MGLAVQVSVSMRKQGYNSSRSQFSCLQQMAIQIQWLLTETQEKRVPVNAEHPRDFRDSLVSRCGLDFYKLKQTTTTTKKSSVAANVTLKCTNRRDDCRTHQVLLPFCIVLGTQLGTWWLLFLLTEIQEEGGLKWEPPKGNTMNQSIWTRRTGKKKWSFRSGECDKWHEKSLCI